MTVLVINTEGFLLVASAYLAAAGFNNPFP
jgi:hypothetical protein